MVPALTTGRLCAMPQLRLPFRGPPRSRKSRVFPFLRLPTELRLEVYSYLLPSDHVPSEYMNVRLVCRSITAEFDGEIIRDYMKYNAAIASRMGWTFHDEPTCFRQTRIVHISFPPSNGYITGAVSELLTRLIPHIRVAKILLNEENGFKPDEMRGGLLLFMLGNTVSHHFEKTPRLAGCDERGLHAVVVDWTSLFAEWKCFSATNFELCMRMVEWINEKHSDHVTHRFYPQQRRYACDIKGVCFTPKMRGQRKNTSAIYTMFKSLTSRLTRK